LTFWPPRAAGHTCLGAVMLAGELG